MFTKFCCKLSEFTRDESGAGTAWAIGWLILCFMIAGISIDVSNGWRVKQFLQSTADTAALSAAMEIRGHGSSNVLEEVQVVANKYADYNMNSTRYGDVLVDDDIVLGTWNSTLSQFTALDPAAPVRPTAVYAKTRQEGGASTVIGTFFLRFAGFEAFTANAVAVAETFVQSCYQDGIIALGSVSMRAQQSFLGEYCVHGELGLSMGGSANGSGQPDPNLDALSVAGNYFQRGTTASTAGGYDLCGQATSEEMCTDEHNPGIEDAYQPDASLTVPGLSDIANMIIDIGNIGSGIYEPENDLDDNYIRVFETATFDADGNIISTSPKGGYLGTRYINSSDFAVTDLIPGYIYNVNCVRGDHSIQLGLDSATLTALGVTGGSVSLGGFVLVSGNCDFDFDSSVNYKNAVFANTGSGTGTASIAGTSYTNFGNIEPTFNCTSDPTIIVTSGDVQFSAGLETANTHFIVGGDMTLAATGNSEELMENHGSNFWVNGDVKLAAGHSFRSCDLRSTNPFNLYYTARLVL